MRKTLFQHVLPSALLAVVTLVFCTLTEAALIINGSRFVHVQDSDETTVSFVSQNNYPVLVQAWIDNGDPRANPDVTAVPFILTPAVARVEARQGQTIRVLGTGGDFPPDRETLFWLNLLEVPPAPKDKIATGDNYLQIAGHARMKFFYRPRGLTVLPEQAHEYLDFSLIPATADGRAQIRVHNGSPYHITFSRLGVRRAGDTAAPLLAEFSRAAGRERMVAPFGELVMPLDAPTRALTVANNLEVAFSVINDLGGATSGRGVLRRRP